MKTREADRMLRKKLGLVSVECKRHTQYIVSGGRKNILPTIVSLSRSSNELSLTNEKGLAQAVGLSLEHWREMIRCHISAECATVVFITHILRFTADRLEILGISYQEIAASVAETCRGICIDLQIASDDLTRTEQLLIGDALTELKRIERFKELRSIALAIERVVKPSGHFQRN